MWRNIMFRALEPQHVEEHYVQSTGTSTCGGTLCSEHWSLNMWRNIMFRALEPQHVEEHYVQSTGTSTCGGTLCSEHWNLNMWRNIMFRALEPQHVEEHYVQSTGTSTCGGTLCQSTGTSTCGGTLCSEHWNLNMWRNIMFRALEPQHVEEHYVQSTGTSTCGGTLCSEHWNLNMEEHYVQSTGTSTCGGTLCSAMSPDSATAQGNKFQQHNEYFYQQYGRHILRLYANQPDPPQSVDEANASGMRVSFQNFIQYLLDPLTERKEPFEPHWRQMQRLCHPCLIKHEGDTASEFNNGFMSLLDPTIAFMRKAAEGSPEYSAVTEEYLKSTKGFMEKFKSLMDGDAVKLDAKISKWEQDLRKKNIFVQAQEEQHAELNKFQQHNEYFYQQYGRHILRLYANQPDPPQSVDEANASGMRVSFQNFIQYLLDPLTERKEPFEPHWRQMQRLCHPCLIKSRGAAGGLFFLFTLLGLVCTAASLMDDNKLLLLKHVVILPAHAPKSRGVAGGLFFLFTLLGLVCSVASLDENKLKNLKEQLQKAEQDLDKLKADRDTASEFINGFMSPLDPMIAFMRKATEGSPESLH
ncbi:hypothetical protein F7725_004382 [Dissostichus mawsoni]|uniref:Carbohydrate sulfotransferase n=1 Tax=Dissostichus mawsoni TaxID=36200 RepID=A0A7J5XL67_DISMA|nr:hypothetical protein F7725_004382 [Dissostichus mawsoni]